MATHHKPRGHAAAAAFLSAVFPGLGQLYNRDWVKAAVMGVLAVGLLVEVTYALGSLATVVETTMAGIDLGHTQTLQRQLLTVAEDPALHAALRWRLFPAVLGLGAVLVWSVVDAVIGARRRARDAGAALPG